MKRIFPVIFPILFLISCAESSDNYNVIPLKDRHINVNATSDRLHAVNLISNSSCVTISDLFSQKKKFAESIVKVKGIVTKVSPSIMNRNWIHIQDGTVYNNQFDLTITSNAIVNEGDTVLFRGKLVTNKDFGHGYFYEILLEDAQLIK